MSAIQPAMLAILNNESSAEYKALFTPDLAGHTAINSVNLYLVIQEFITIAEKTSPSPECLVYRHCGYALTSVLMKQLKARINGSEILEAEEIKNLISIPFDEVRQRFANQYRIDGVGSALHAFFKRITDTAKLIQQVSIKQQKLDADPNVINLIGRQNDQDPYNQALSDYLVGKVVQL